jgi:hypothetical protein
LRAPGRIEQDLGPLRVEHLEHLGLIGLRVRGDLLGSERRARRVAARGIADHAGEIADQEHDVVPKVLELAHLVQQDGMPQVQVGGRGIEPGLHPQGLPAGELPHQVLFHDQLVGAAPDDIEMGRLSH